LGQGESRSGRASTAQNIVFVLTAKFCVGSFTTKLNFILKFTALLRFHLKDESPEVGLGLSFVEGNLIFQKLFYMLQDNRTKERLPRGTYHVRT
jgi:hypothetical protein